MPSYPIRTHLRPVGRPSGTRRPLRTWIYQEIQSFCQVNPIPIPGQCTEWVGLPRESQLTGGSTPPGALTPEFFLLQMFHCFPFWFSSFGQDSESRKKFSQIEWVNWSPLLVSDWVQPKNTHTHPSVSQSLIHTRFKGCMKATSLAVSSSHPLARSTAIPNRISSLWSTLTWVREHWNALSLIFRGTTPLSMIQHSAVLCSIPQQCFKQCFWQIGHTTDPLVNSSELWERRRGSSQVPAKEPQACQAGWGNQAWEWIREGREGGKGGRKRWEVEKLS